MNESAKQQAFTEGSIFRSLIRFALPVLGALALQAAYGAAAYVAQNVGTGKPDRAKKGFFTAIVCGCTAGLLLFSLGFFGGGILSTLFTDDAEVALQSANYLKGYSLECILSCILFACCGYLNGNGYCVPVLLQGTTSTLLFRIPLATAFSKLANATLVLIGIVTPITTAYGIAFFLLCFLIIKLRRKKPAEEVVAETEETVAEETEI